MKIGLIGEAPNDVNAIKYLFQKRYVHLGIEWVVLLNNINGDQLENQKTKRFLRREYELLKPDIVIFIRDLDSLQQDRAKILERKTYFNEFNSVTNKRGVFLLHIYEIEALILADIETFNLLYKAKVPKVIDPTQILEPKEYLKTRAKQYNETHNAAIFQKMNFENALRCRYFKDFVDLFETKIK